MPEERDEGGKNSQYLQEFGSTGKRRNRVIAGRGGEGLREDFFKMKEITLYLYANGNDPGERGKLVKQYLH